MYKLIIGASGYLGKAINNQLKQHGYKVLGYKSKTKSPSYKFSLDQLNFIDELEDVDEVILTAGISGKAVSLNPSLSYKINVENTKKSIDEFTRKNIFINFISSSAVFNIQQNLAHEDDLPKPLSLYGQQKLIIENYLIDKCVNGNKFRIIRPTKVLSLESNIIAAWLNKSELSDDIEINPTIKIAPISLKSFVDSLLKILMSDTFGTFHLSGAETINLIDLINALQAKKFFIKDPSIKISESYFDDNASILGMQKTLEKVGIKPQTCKNFYNDLFLFNL